MPGKDYYQILGISRDADQETIKKAYRKLAMQYHPDKNPGKEKWANEKFKEINEAFCILGDPDKKQHYDRFGTAASVGNVYSNAATKNTFEDLMRDFGGSGMNVDFLNEIFGPNFQKQGFVFKVYGFGPGAQNFNGNINLGDIFRMAMGGRPSPRPPRKPIETPCVNCKVKISRDDALKGLEKDIRRKGHKLRIKIPPGIKNGMEVRLRNALQITDGKPGDIMVQVQVS